MPTWTSRLTWKSTGDGEPFVATVAVEADEEVNGNITVDPNTTEEISVAFDPDNLQGVRITSDQHVNLLVNDEDDPDQVIGLQAGRPFRWFARSGIPNPFLGDVTVLYLANAGDVAANVTIRLAWNNQGAP